MGPPGVGKSTIASMIARLDGATVSRTDYVRKRLFGDPTYSSAESTATYTAMLGTAIEYIQTDRSIVLDGTFSELSGRKRARSIAEAFDADYEQVRIQCDEDVVEQRIENRDGLSDADFEVYQDVAADFDPTQYPTHRIDNSGPIEDTEQQVEAIVDDA